MLGRGGVAAVEGLWRFSVKHAAGGFSPRSGVWHELALQSSFVGVWT